MSQSSSIRQARERAGLTQRELARRAHTSRPTLSAYESGRVSPTESTLGRILAAAGCATQVVPRISWRRVPVGRGRSAAIPSSLPRLDPAEALGRVTLPLHLDWSTPGRTVDLADRNQRARAYETILREGREQDVATLVDGVLLVDLWNELVLPRLIRDAWQPILDEALAGHD